MKPKKINSEAPRQQGKPPIAQTEESGTNAVQHQPDPQARPVPDGDPKYIPPSPFTSGSR